MSRWCVRRPARSRLAAIAIGTLTARRSAASAIGGIVLLAVGIIGIRSQAVADGLKFVGVKQGNAGPRQRPELPPTNAARLHRRPHLPRPPVLGVGWQGRRTIRLPAVRRTQSGGSTNLGASRPAHPWGGKRLRSRSRTGPRPGVSERFLLPPPWPSGPGGRPPDRRVALTLLTIGCWNGFGLVAEPGGGTDLVAAGLATAAAQTLPTPNRSAVNLPPMSRHTNIQAEPPRPGAAHPPGRSASAGRLMRDEGQELPASDCRRRLRVKPYLPFFAASRRGGVIQENRMPTAGAIESLPVEDGSSTSCSPRRCSSIDDPARGSSCTSAAPGGACCVDTMVNTTQPRRPLALDATGLERVRRQRTGPT